MNTYFTLKPNVFSEVSMKAMIDGYITFLSQN